MTKELTQSQRFQVKYTNGTWVVFDSVEYENIRVFTLKKEANEVQKMMNRKGK